MHWFEGTIAEAVAKSKASNAVFVVFVEGADDMSRELDAALCAPDVAVRLEDRSKFLAIKLSSTSPNYAHFAMIYKFVPVPSVFFIGRDGSPLEVVCAGVTPDILSERIDRILTQHYEGTPSDLTAAGQQPGPSAASSSQAFIQTEAHAQVDTSHKQRDPPTETALEKDNVGNKPEENQVEAGSSEASPTASDQPPTADAAEYEVVCDGDVCVRRPKQAEPSDGASAQQMAAESHPRPESPAVDERVERAKELIEAKRREKEAKEKELEKQREIERRSVGKSVAELKRWQADQELKQAAEERKNERIATMQARQRVLEQIEQDRAERRARQATIPTVPTVTTPAPIESPADGSAASQARIQLKLVDGSTHVVTLSADDTIADLYAHITTEISAASAGTFTLWTAFPRRELPAGAETLRSLGLAPSAALLLLSVGGSSAPGGPAALPAPAVRLYALITSLLAALIVEPVRSAWAWLSARLFPTPPRAASPAPLPRANPAPGVRYRPQSNVHRLREDRSSDDENNTWNGNSTQQM